MAMPDFSARPAIFLSFPQKMRISDYSMKNPNFKILKKLFGSAQHHITKINQGLSFGQCSSMAMPDFSARPAIFLGFPQKKRISNYSMKNLNFKILKKLFGSAQHHITKIIQGLSFGQCFSMAMPDFSARPAIFLSFPQKMRISDYSMKNLNFKILKKLFGSAQHHSIA